MAWNDTHQTADDPNNPADNEKITATEWNNMVDTIESHHNDTTIHYTQSEISIPASQISDFSEAVDDDVNSLLVGGNNVTLSYDDTNNTLTIDVDETAIATSNLNNDAGFVVGSGTATITVASSAPGSPAVGDLWVDTGS